MRTRRVLLLTSIASTAAVGALVAGALNASTILFQRDASPSAALSQNQVRKPIAGRETWAHATTTFVDAAAKAVGIDLTAPPSRPWRGGGVPDPNSALSGTTALTASNVTSAKPALVSGATGQLNTGLLPYQSFASYALTTDTTAKVDLGNGNLVLQSNDGSLNTAGVGLSNDRYFNSTSTIPGSLGGNWSSPLSGLDVGLAIGSPHTYFVAPSGNVESFTASGSGWTHPPQFNATLTTTGSTPTLVFNSTGEKLTFNSSGWLTSDVNANGIGNTYTYNAAGGVTQVTEPAGRFYTINWTTSGSNTYISSIVDSAGRTTTYQHNAAGQLTEVDSPGSYWEQYTYDSAGRVSEIQAVGQTSSTNVKIDFSYDSSSRVTAIKQGVVGSSSWARQTTFSGWGASSTMTVTDGNGHTTQYGENAYNIPISYTDADGNTTSWTHNANGDVTSVTYPGTSSPTANCTFNSNYSPLTGAQPTGAASSASYGTATGCSGSGGTAYDPHCTVDPSGDKTAYTYDSNGNLMQTADTTSGGTGVTGTSYTYATAAGGCYTTGSGGSTVIHGLAGQVCSATTSNGNTTTYQYDGSGDKTGVTPPSPQHATTYAYDSLGRVTSITDGNGKTTSYTYNVRDQVLTTTYAGGTVDTVTYTPNALQATTYEGSSDQETYSYDSLNELTQQWAVHAGRTSITENYSYDYAGNLVAYTDPYGTVYYVYDSADRLTQLIEPSGSCGSGTPAASSGCIRFSYDAMGKETKRTYPGGATVATTRDMSERPTRITATNAAGTVVYDKGYSYSLSGTDTSDIQKATSYVETGVPSSAVTTYSYDSLDRLGSAVEKTSGGTTNASWAYSYDGDGNMKTATVAGALGSGGRITYSPGTYTLNYNADDELTSTSADSTSWTYDNTGAQTTDGLTGEATTYNDRDGVATQGTGTYSTYGAGNDPTYRRVDSSTTTDFTNSAVLGLMGEDYGNQRIYDRTPDGTVVGSRLSGGSRYYFIQDAIGSTVGLFDVSGAYLGGYTYTPYGDARYTGGNIALSNNHIRYAGGYYDTSSGMTRLGARYYNPVTGRFTQEDPSGQESNPYAYAVEDPINTTDSSGLYHGALWQCQFVICTLTLSRGQTALINRILQNGYLAITVIAACVTIASWLSGFDPEISLFFGAWCPATYAAAGITFEIAADRKECVGFEVWLGSNIWSTFITKSRSSCRS